MQINIPRKLQGLFLPYRYKVAYGGRGSAKSWSFARALITKAGKEGKRVLCAREFQNSIEESVHQLLADQIHALGLDPYFRIQQKAIEGPGGCRFFFKGLHRNIDAIKSAEGVDIVWVEEAHNVTEETWDKLIPTVRKAGSEIWISFNPELKKDPTYQRFVVHTPPDTLLVFMNWEDNPFFPETLNRERLQLLDSDIKKYRWIYGGECKTEVTGALWKLETIKENRCTPAEVPELYAIAIGVDPMGSKDQEESETGIVLAGAGVDGRFYILGDFSLHGTPKQWASKVASVYHENGGFGYVIAEVNYGGDMVAEVIANQDRRIPVKCVHASRGKLIRAEPVSLAYEQGRVSHVGTFPDLEDEMTSYTGKPGERSPNRLDAMVWAMLHLMDVSGIEPEGIEIGPMLQSVTEFGR